MAEPKTQLDKFKEAARELECDDGEQRFKERLGKLVKAKLDAKGGKLRIGLVADADPPWAIETVILDHEPKIGEQIEVHERTWEIVAKRGTPSNAGTLFADVDDWAFCRPA